MAQYNLDSLVAAGGGSGGGYVTGDVKEVLNGTPDDPDYLSAESAGVYLRSAYPDLAGGFPIEADQLPSGLNVASVTGLSRHQYFTAVEGGGWSFLISSESNQPAIISSNDGFATQQEWIGNTISGTQITMAVWSDHHNRLIIGSTNFSFHTQYFNSDVLFFNPATNALEAPPDTISVNRLGISAVAPDGSIAIGQSDALPGSHVYIMNADFTPLIQANYQTIGLPLSSAYVTGIALTNDWLFIAMNSQQTTMATTNNQSCEVFAYNRATGAIVSMLRTTNNTMSAMGAWLDGSTLYVLFRLGTTTLQLRTFNVSNPNIVTQTGLYNYTPGIPMAFPVLWNASSGNTFSLSFFKGVICLTDRDAVYFLSPDLSSEFVVNSNTSATTGASLLLNPSQGLFRCFWAGNGNYSLARQPDRGVISYDTSTQFKVTASPVGLNTHRRYKV